MNRRSLAIVGHSHVACVATALARLPIEGVEAVNLWATSEPEDWHPQEFSRTLRRMVRNANPAVICLCMGGNEHNVLGVAEHPEPFSVGDMVEGSAPADPDRWFVPRAVMRDALREYLEPVRRWNEIACETFAGSAKVFFSPPPPIADWEHIQSHPGVFREALDLGPAPNALRMALYRLQTELLKEMATRAGAGFIEPPDEALDGDGLLAKRYFGRSPTHANDDYGAIMLRAILERVELAT
jgi:hypothetical protein